MSYEEFIEKYGDIEVTFSSYYKYYFRYSAVVEDGNELIVEIGGDADDIYRMTVGSNDSATIRDLDLSNAWIADKRGIILESFYFN